jgi:hypothetical protein
MTYIELNKSVLPKLKHENTTLSNITIQNKDMSRSGLPISSKLKISRKTMVLLKDRTDLKNVF